MSIYPQEYILHPQEYEDLLVVLGGYTREKAKKIVDEMYEKQYGQTREEAARESEEFFVNSKDFGPDKTIVVGTKKED